MINYLDLFSGCGGFRKGLEEAGFTFGWEGHSEIDKYANQVYAKHFPESEELGDIKSIRPEDLPEINLITFGFPCQDLSIAGKRRGLEASRSGLFYEAMRIIRATKPDYFIFENVKGLFSSNGGLDWFNVLREIADSGYDGQWQLLNTRWFLPQNRERIYFVGYSRKGSRPKIFPIGESGGEANKGGGGFQEQIASTLFASQHKIARGMDLIQVGNIDTKGNNSIWGRVYDPEGCAATLNSGGGGLGAKTGLYEVQRHPLKFLERNQKNIDGDYAYTIDSVNTGGIKDSTGIRRLTPIECERLQGFEGGWTDGVSDTQRYKMMGNTVSVPVVKAVAERIIEGGFVKQ